MKQPDEQIVRDASPAGTNEAPGPKFLPPAEEYHEEQNTHDETDIVQMTSNGVNRRVSASGISTLSGEYDGTNIGDTSRSAPSNMSSEHRTSSQEHKDNHRSTRKSAPKIMGLGASSQERTEDANGPRGFSEMPMGAGSSEPRRFSSELERQLYTQLQEEKRKSELSITIEDMPKQISFSGLPSDSDSESDFGDLGGGKKGDSGEMRVMEMSMRRIDRIDPKTWDSSGETNLNFSGDVGKVNRRSTMEFKAQAFSEYKGMMAAFSRNLGGTEEAEPQAHIKLEAFKREAAEEKKKLAAKYGPPNIELSRSELVLLMDGWNKVYIHDI